MDVGGWLCGLGLGKYEAAFLENGIGEAVLPHLTVEDLKEIGVATGGDRGMLLAAIAALATLTSSEPIGPQPSPALPTKTPEVSAERRPITVMFCDLVGSTSLAAKLDAVDWRNLLNAYLDEASKAISALGGHVLKRLGDGLMALFRIGNTPTRRCKARQFRKTRWHPVAPVTCGSVAGWLDLFAAVRTPSGGGASARPMRSSSGASKSNSL
jgi:class 3 adenylate cyclase